MRSRLVSGSAILVAGVGIVGTEFAHAVPPKPNSLAAIISSFGSACNSNAYASSISFPFQAWDGSGSAVNYVHHKDVNGLVSTARAAVGLDVNALRYGGGMYHCRKKRNSSDWSTHAWGIATDTNTVVNPQGSSCCWNGTGWDGLDHGTFIPDVWQATQPGWNVNFTWGRIGMISITFSTPTTTNAWVSRVVVLMVGMAAVAGCGTDEPVSDSIPSALDALLGDDPPAPDSVVRTEPSASATGSSGPEHPVGETPSTTEPHSQPVAADHETSALFASSAPLEFEPPVAQCDGPPPRWVVPVPGLALAPGIGTTAIVTELTGSPRTSTGLLYPTKSLDGAVIAYVDVRDAHDQHLMVSQDGGRSFGDVLATPQIDGVAVSPSGRRVAVSQDGLLQVADLSDLSVWTVLPLPAPAPHMLPGDLVWMDDDRLVFVVDQAVPGVSGEFAALANLWISDRGAVPVPVTSFDADGDNYTLAATPTRVTNDVVGFVVLRGSGQGGRDELRNQLFTVSLSGSDATEVRDLPVDAYLAGTWGPEVLVNVPAQYGEWLITTVSGGELSVLGCGAMSVVPTTGGS